MKCLLSTLEIEKVCSFLRRPCSQKKPPVAEELEFSQKQLKKFSQLPKQMEPCWSSEFSKIFRGSNLLF